VVLDALPVPLYPPPVAPTAAFGSTDTASTSFGSTFGFGGSTGVGAGGGVGCGCACGDGLPID